MNKSFKVVFSKARSALMVVNEATSSIQAKGTKTVIAAAAAAMIAGGAMAEPTATPATAVTVGQDGVLTATTTMKDGTTTTAYAATGTVSVGTGADAYQWGSKADTVTDQLGDTSVVTLAGGSLVSVDTDQSVASIAGKGSLVINANTSAGAKITEETGLTDETTHDNLNIDMTVFNSKDGTVKAETTLTLAGNGARTLAAGTLKTAASDKSDGTANKGVAKVVANGDLTFGAEEVKTTNGSVTTPATAYNFDINADTEVSSTTGSVVHAAGKTTVAADTKLTFAASTQGKTVTIGKDVSFANAGLVSVQSSGAVFNANYDATANTGKLLITGAADKADTITIGGTIANGEVKVGDTFTTDSKTQAVTDTAAVALNGTTVAVSETGALKPATLTLAGGTLNVNGAVEATDTKVTGVAVLATQSGTVNQKTVYGSAKLGNVVVENAETQNTLSVSNADADNAITATSLTVKGATAAAGTAKATQGGKFTLTSGAFTAGTLSVGSGATVELTAGKFTVNGTGASTNEGTITFVNFLKTANTIRF